MNQLSFELAKSKFDSGNFPEAFEIFKIIANDSSRNDIERSDAFNMLGVIILFDPTLDIEDESGLKYFHEAIKQDSNNLGALLNVIESFGASLNCHQNIELFNYAYNKLISLNYEFSKDEIQRIEQKLKIINS